MSYTMGPNRRSTVPGAKLSLAGREAGLARQARFQGAHEW